MQKDRAPCPAFCISTKHVILESCWHSKTGGATRLFRFYLPLGATSTLTSVSHYIVAAALAQTPNSVAAFAAYSLGQSLGFLFEGPASGLRTAAMAMATTGSSWRTVHRTALAVVGFTFMCQLAVFFSPLGAWVLERVAGVPAQLVPDTVTVSRITAFAVVGSALRFLYQGIQVRWRSTDGVLAGILVRLGTMALVAWAVTATGWPGGGGSGVLVLAGGMLAEGVVGYLSYRRAERQVTAEWYSPEPPLSPGAVLRFILPLALSGILISLMRPAVNGALTTGGPEAVAAFALTTTLINLMLGPVSNLHQVAIVFSGDDRGPALRFALKAGAVLSACTMLLTLKPVGSWMIGTVIGAPATLIPGALLGLAFQIPMPLIMAISENRMGLLFLARSSRAVGIARLLRFGVTVGLLWPALALSTPATAPGFASAALVGGALVELLMLQAVLMRVAPVHKQPSLGA